MSVSETIASVLTGFDYASRAIVGARDNQEDACQFAKVGSAGTLPLGRHGARRSGTLLAVLADGMGGHAGGAEASSTACASFVEAYEAGDATVSGRLAGALAASNRAIAAALDRDRSLAGMGCTLIGAAFTPAGIAWVSVGDSPLLLFRSGRLYQLNEDHSLGPMLDKLADQGEISLEEAQNNPRRHFLLAALTGGEIEMVDLASTVVPLRAGDVVLLASDGIDVLDHGELADLLAAHADDRPEALADAVLAAIEALGAPNQDNATVMAVKPVFGG